VGRWVVVSQSVNRIAGAGAGLLRAEARTLKPWGPPTGTQPDRACFHASAQRNRERKPPNHTEAILALLAHDTGRDRQGPL
jgi:hypothetical protein